MIFFLGGFYVGFLKNGTSIFHGSSVRMGPKIYILPIYSTYILLFHYTMPARIVTSARALIAALLATGGGTGRQP
jgi:hypothetical protein